MAQIPHQYEVSVLRGSVLGRQFEDVSLLNELVSRVHNVLFSPEQLVHLQQLPHALLRDTKAHKLVNRNTTITRLLIFP